MPQPADTAGRGGRPARRTAARSRTPRRRWRPPSRRGRRSDRVRCAPVRGSVPVPPPLASRTPQLAGGAHRPGRYRTVLGQGAPDRGAEMMRRSPASPARGGTGCRGRCTAGRARPALTRPRRCALRCSWPRPAGRRRARRPRPARRRAARSRQDERGDFAAFPSDQQLGGGADQVRAGEREEAPLGYRAARRRSRTRARSMERPAVANTSRASTTFRRVPEVILPTATATPCAHSDAVKVAVAPAQALRPRPGPARPVRRLN